MHTFKQALLNPLIAFTTNVLRYFDVFSFITNLYVSRQLIFFQVMHSLVDYVVLLFHCSRFATQIRLNFLETLY